MTQYTVNLSDKIAPTDTLLLSCPFILVQSLSDKIPTATDTLNYVINVNPANLYGIISRIIQLANIPTQNVFIGEQIKTIDYARTDGIIIRQKETTDTTYLINGALYNEYKFKLIIASKSETNYYNYLESLRKLRAITPFTVNGNPIVVSLMKSAEYDTAQRGIFREEYEMSILIPFGV
ncbi:MAG: hypothetical protein QXF41_02860 [Candidatus Micrarchaeaceae archaeon]